MNPATEVVVFQRFTEGTHNAPNAIMLAIALDLRKTVVDPLGLTERRVVRGDN